MFEKPHTKGGQVEEDQAQQIPTFSCSERPFFYIAKILLLALHGEHLVHCPLFNGANHTAIHQPLNGKGYIFVELENNHFGS